MLSVMSGHLGGVKHNLDLVPVVKDLLEVLQKPDEQALRRMVREEQTLIPLFARPSAAFSGLPMKVQGIIGEYQTREEAAKLSLAFEGRGEKLRRHWEDE